MNSLLYFDTPSMYMRPLWGLNTGGFYAIYDIIANVFAFNSPYPLTKLHSSNGFVSRLMIG